MNYFVTAIGTDSGKTLVSAILCEALKADYWKPIQAGFPKDSDTVRALVSNHQTVIHPERYLLNTPASPHAAARIDSVAITLGEIRLPATSNDLVIEGAGGCLVPINDHHFIIDIAGNFSCELVLVANLYLGSINHTLLTAFLLKSKGIKVKGIIFNGQPNAESERIILRHTGYTRLAHIAQEEKINKETVSRYASLIKAIWK